VSVDQGMDEHTDERVRPIVLHIEDDDINRRLMGSIFGHQIPHADLVSLGRGNEALEWLDAHDAALILLDGQLDDMTAVQFVESLRAGGDPGSDAPPIVMVSGTHPADHPSLAGLAGYVTKPFRVADIVATIQRFL
jgi:CheY-like chemotaxis protein